MLEVLNVSVDESIRAIEVIELNLAWRNSHAAEDIRKWFNKVLETTSTELMNTKPTDSTILSTESTSTKSSGSKIILSTVLGIACTIMRLLL